MREVNPWSLSMMSDLLNAILGPPTTGSCDDVLPGYDRPRAHVAPCPNTNFMLDEDYYRYLAYSFLKYVYLVLA